MMSGRRWIVILLAAISVSFTGCQVNGGATRMWNPFARADQKDGIDEEQLPKFVRRVNDDDDESKKEDSPIAESRVEALLAEGQRGLQDNRIPEARRAYDEVLQLLPDDPTAHHGLAMAADLTENWVEAEEHYRQALRARPRDANLLCDMGYSYLLQNRYSEAASYLSQAIQINPNHENAHANLALLDVRQGNREAARERLTQRYSDPARVTQILASLESRPGSQTAAVALTSTTGEIPKNASFEEIREIANRERIAAEQRRAAINVPVDQDSAIHSVSATNLQYDQGQYVHPPHGSAQHPGQFSGPGVAATTAETLPTGSYVPVSPAPGSYLPNMGIQTPPAFSTQFGSQPTTTSQMNPMAASPQHAVNPSHFNGNENQQPPHSNIQIQPKIFPPVNPGAVVAVRPSGSFQPPTQGVSYGQPMGFNQPPANAAGYPGELGLAAPDIDQVHGNASPGNTFGQPAANMTGQQNLTLGQQYPNTNQSTSHVQLDGLNIGPGSLFPIGQGAGHQDGQLRMGNTSPPGSNSVINGAMYGQPVSTLPSQEWMMQQQQQIQQRQSQQSSTSQNGQGYAEQNYTNQGYSNPQYAGNAPYGAQSVQQNRVDMPNGNGATTAPRPGNQSQPINPLSSYENQLRQLDNQYNNTLQQLDPNPNAAVPRAQY